MLAFMTADAEIMIKVKEREAKLVNFVPLSDSFIDLLLFLNVTAVENSLICELQNHLGLHN